MAKTSVDIPQLKFNKMSTAKYEELKSAGQLNDNEFYITPDGGTLPEVNESTNDFVLSNNGTDLNWIQETEYTKNRIDSKLDENTRTNCLTKIPQDIKLESTEGVLTLKAGSKVYIPNGVGVFDEVFIDSDLTTDFSANSSGSVVIFVPPSKNFLDNIIVSNCVSGSTHEEKTYSVWYDTTNNVINLYTTNASIADRQVSLPIAIIDITQGSSSSTIQIRQVFNGFGYIGSTVFALPGVEGIIPNGRNADGSLNNIKFTTTNVLLTGQFSGDFDAQIVMSGNDIGSYYYSYDDYNNLVRRTDTNEIYNGIILGNVSGKNNILTSLKPKNVFQLIDRNDTEWLVGLGMPSDKYIDMDIQASRSKYTAPADGYFTVTGAVSGSLVCLVDVATDLGFTSGYENGVVSGVATIQVKKGREVMLIYSKTPSVFRFVYTEGSKE